MAREVITIGGLGEALPRFRDPQWRRYVRQTKRIRRSMGDATTPEEGGVPSDSGDSTPQGTPQGATAAAANAASSAAAQSTSYPTPPPAQPPTSKAAGLVVVGAGVVGVAWAIWKHFR